MRSAYLILIALFLLSPFANAQNEKSEEMFASTKTYLEAMSIFPIDSIISASDRLISVMSNKEDSTRMAGTIFDYYSTCPVMGTEAVAVHIADNYFLNGKLKWPSEDSYPGLFAFAEFNRASLLGKSAPELRLISIDSSYVDVRAVRSPLKLLYFYEDGCSSCAIQTPQIADLLKNYTGSCPIAFFAIYTQSSREQWEQYVKAHFSIIDNPNVQVFHLWDPELDSDFQRKYGVLTTPATFLLNSENTIIGRKLDSRAVAKLLGSKDDYRSSLLLLFENLTNHMGLGPESAKEIAEVFMERSKNDLDNLRCILYELFQFYRNLPIYDSQLSAAMIGKDYIVNNPLSWASETVDEVKWVLSKMEQNPVGSKATDEYLPNNKGIKKRMLAGRSDYTILLFNIAYCQDCQIIREYLADMGPLLKQKKAKVVSVYMSADREFWETFVTINKKWTHLIDDDPSSQLRQDYDLSIVPRLYLLDKNKTIIAKDLSISELSDILNNDKK